jgi:methionyl-tRNA formyltransferase
MRIVFTGTPEFAIPTLVEISRSGLVSVAVYTRAPAQRGRRGLEFRKAPVHLTADSIGIPVFTPNSLRDAETQRQFEDQAADVALVIAYGLLLPIPILDAKIGMPQSPRLAVTAMAGRSSNPTGYYGGRQEDRG